MVASSSGVGARLSYPIAMTRMAACPASGATLIAAPWLL